MTQLDIFGNENAQSEAKTETGSLIDIRDGQYRFFKEFYPQSDSDRFFSALKEKTVWKQESMKMYGREIPFPRLTAWYGDIDRPYSFSGITLFPLPWFEELLEIKARVEDLSKTKYNSVLLNLYRDGNDSISWHSDAEPELGENPIISSINFGAARTFQLRHRLTREQIDFDLGHGTALIMQGELQHFWQHQVPKTKKLVGDRINLTFRTINNR